MDIVTSAATQIRMASVRDKSLHQFMKAPHGAFFIRAIRHIRAIRV
jgi:hypothetical protein